jgi:hypothetical protein
MTTLRHLTEAERHEVADGSMSPELRADVVAHLEHCEACASDVARVKQLMTRIREAPALDPATSGGDLWPEIRARIEREKIVQLPATDVPPRGTRFVRTAVWLVGGLAAALLLLVALPQTRGKGKALPPSVSEATRLELQLVADSTRVFEREATILLNELELRRAMIRPQQRTTIDRDLKVIDDAILELKAAIGRDPNNPALRRLLAASYRQKIDVLKRAGGTG